MDFGALSSIQFVVVLISVSCLITELYDVSNLTGYSIESVKRDPVQILDRIFFLKSKLDPVQWNAEIRMLEMSDYTKIQTRLSSNFRQLLLSEICGGWK